MNEHQAIELLTQELEKKDTDIYYFQPEGGQQNFIAESVITGAAIVLVTAFLKGLESTLQPKVKKWGAELGTWVGNQLESLFKPAAKPSTETDIDRIAGTVKSLIAKTPPEQRDQVASEVERFLENVLSLRGVSEKHAASIAASTRRSAMELVGV